MIGKVLNLKFEEWLDFFTYKKDIQFLEQIEKEKNVTLPRVEELLNKIDSSENDDSYFSIFLFLLYNVKCWFNAKRERKEKLEK